MVLFVILAERVDLNDSFRQKNATVIRQNTTPRHVPAEIIKVADIPRTISGKIVELAVRDAVHRQPLKNIDALANPCALELFKYLPELQR